MQASSAVETQKTGLRIPAALQVLAASSSSRSSSQCGNWTASAAVVASLPGGAAKCNYWLAMDWSQTGSLCIVGMLFKPAHSHANFGADGAPQLMYSVQWEASDCVDAVQNRQHASAAVQQSLSWEVRAGYTLNVHARSTAAAISGVQGSLSLLQSVNGSQEGATVTLHTQMSVSGILNRSAVHAAVPGLLKAAACESPVQYFAHFNHDARGLSLAEPLASSTDHFGATLSGMWL